MVSKAFGLFECIIPSVDVYHVLYSRTSNLQMSLSMRPHFLLSNQVHAHAVPARCPYSQLQFICTPPSHSKQIAHILLLSKVCDNASSSRCLFAPERFLNLIDQLTQRGRRHRNIVKFETLPRVLHEPDIDIHRFAVRRQQQSSPMTDMTALRRAAVSLLHHQEQGNAAYAPENRGII